MAGRKDKNTVDYFPHYVNHGKTLFIIESKFKSDGYTTWFKILEILGKSENHYIDCRKKSDYEYLSAKIPLMQTELKDIINLLAELDAIHRELWENNIIWSNNFIKELEDVYRRRNNLCMNFLDLCKHLNIKCKHKYNENGIVVNENTQSRVEYSKVYIYNEFYDNEINISNNDESYINFVKFLFGRNDNLIELKNVLSLKQQLSYQSFKKCAEIAKNNNVKIKDKILSMENKKDLNKKYTSFNLTLQNWIRNDFARKIN